MGLYFTISESSGEAKAFNANIKYFHVKRKLLRGYELVTLLTEALVRP